AAALAGHAAAFTAHACNYVTDVASRDNGIVIVLIGECAGIVLCLMMLWWLGGLCLLM
ncbi:hypothetical protein Tco_1567491, partial [Tanacetum coccineum]